ncbi:PD-(D/E)XK nuclease family protein [Aquiflexum gelatinilyticum]|uniref:PD-(D/E)XK nuclease family protein n=1 Tax=Aquiflexum gelatinilyticum TaxID=2961943 RepID=A0A9X2P4U6_9BACT|nr:PD-(D/E)XK nuclease family protein [Aquiflexum gelatinilyticum]MCR9015337.1 PD-(D/E)XK nuclease family protein [Aquiflexum gelatinilyticum]
MTSELYIKNFFSNVETKIKLTEQLKNYYGKEIAPNFNSFDFWWIDENKVSAIISFFLNPIETHEHGYVYLRHFIKKFELDFFQFNENDKVTVQCEYRIDKGRRIDIIINKNNFEQVIAIENKIYVGTADQQNQIADYLDFLASQTKNNYCLIYLSPQDKTVSNESISAEERENYINESRLKILSYEEQMIECLNEFGNLTQNNRVKSFINDFEKKLRRMYMGEKNINTQEVVVDLINENVQNLEIAFLVSNSLQEVKRQLKHKFEEQIFEIGQELNLEVKGLKLRPSKWTNNRIIFNYEKGGLLFGLIRLQHDNNKTRFPEIETQLENELREKFFVSGWWPMWQFFYKNIENSEQFWIDIESGKAKERAKTFIKLICDNFNDEKY